MIRAIVPLFAMALVASVPAFAAETVSVPHFDAVGLRGGGSVTHCARATQRVTILEGSSQFTHIYVQRSGSLEIDACDRNCPQHYRLRLEVQSLACPDLGGRWRRRHQRCSGLSFGT